MPTVASSALEVNTPIKGVDANDKTLVITNDPAKPLRPGVHQFRLIVTDDAGNPSQAAIAEVIVLDRAAPTAVVLPSPLTINFGGNATLDGSRSSDIGGTVVSWEWTLMSQQ